MAPVNLRLTEKAFAQQVVDLARLLGWRVYRTWLSVRSPAGFPDLVLVRPPRLIFAELKSEKGRLTPAQEAWLELLRQVPGAEVYVWRPADLEEIAAVLRDVLPRVVAQQAFQLIGPERPPAPEAPDVGLDGDGPGAEQTGVVIPVPVEGSPAPPAALGNNSRKPSGRRKHPADHPGHHSTQ
mgnify:CR=1 FL=1